MEITTAERCIYHRNFEEKVIWALYVNQYIQRTESVQIEELDRQARTVSLKYPIRLQGVTFEYTLGAWGQIVDIEET